MNLTDSQREQPYTITLTGEQIAWILYCLEVGFNHVDTEDYQALEDIAESINQQTNIY